MLFSTASGQKYKIIDLGSILLIFYLIGVIAHGESISDARLALSVLYDPASGEKLKKNEKKS